MREIKFRAWHKTYDLLCDVVEIVFGDDDNYVAVENGEYIERWRFDDIELMQYTGLKDVHGVKIYEGDIVKWGDQPNGHESPIRIGVVELNPDIQFITNAGIFEYGRFAYKETNKYLTVIGNKFENPESLEVAE
ncbi:YopX family protein [Latilactobacillus sakei]